MFNNLRNSPISCVVIPARLQSSRFPGKVLVDVCGKPLIKYVCESAERANIDGVLVATADSEIKKVVEGFGTEVVETSHSHLNGSSRVAEVLDYLPKTIEIIINLQADEPLVSAEDLNLLRDIMLENPEISVATMATKWPGGEVSGLESEVKVVISKKRALYFSRAPLKGSCKHVGVYAYRRSFLSLLKGLDPSPLAQAEKLEQLTFLELGYDIGIVLLDHFTVGVDTPADYEKLVTYYVTERRFNPL